MEPHNFQRRGRSSGNGKGRTLLEAADAAHAADTAPKRRRTLLSRLGLAKEREPIAIEEQLDIVRAAGRWFIFSGERGQIPYAPSASRWR